MLTYLELVQKVARETSASEPSTTTGQTGESRRLVDWVNDAWLDIQNKHDTGWRWLRHGFTVNTAASDDTYTYSDCSDSTSASAITRFGQWRLNDNCLRPKCYLTSSGVGSEYWLNYLCWEDFCHIYKIGSQSTGSPAHITIDPQNQLVIGPTPDAAYTITGEYYRSAQTLVADSDTPEMPEQFHNLIVWYAMEHYGYSEIAQEAIGKAKTFGKRMLKQLEGNQLERIKIAGPMV